MKKFIWTAIRVTTCMWSFAFVGGSRYEAQADAWQIENSQPILSFDFEDSQTCDDGWSFELDDASRVWHCGQVTTGPRGGVFNSHGAMFASTLGTPGPLAGIVVSPEIQLPQRPSYLSLESWNDFEASDLGMSGGRVLVFLGDRRHPLGPVDGYSDPENKFSVSDLAAQRHWRRLVFDLTKYVGKTVRLGFEVVGQGSNPGAGWFVDDVVVGLGRLTKADREYRLRDCQSGQVLRFNFSECLDDWQTESDSSNPVWHCAPPSLDPDPAVPPGPAGDSPAYFKDGSGRLMATEPGGAYPPGVVAMLTSPPIDLARCPGRIFLSFWHWYHFAPGDGGYVELWNGRQWTRLNPVGGYSGQITGTSLGKGIDGYASEQDMPSGWRRAVFHLTAHLSEKRAQKIRVRFVFASAPGRASRPGWYLDTIEIGRGLEFFAGDLDCNLPAFDLGQFDPNPGLPKDPCLEGRLVAPSRVVVAQSGQDGAPNPSDNPNSPNPPVVFQAQSPGWMCVEILRGTAEGSFLSEGMSLVLDGNQVPLNIGADETQIRHRAPLLAGWHSVQLAVQHGVATYRVWFAEHATGPLSVPSLLHKQPKLRVQNLRMFGAQGNQASQSRITGQFLLPYPQAVPGLGEITAVYQLRLVRADTCKEVLRVTGEAPFDSNSHLGTGERIASFARDWNRLDLGGAFVAWDVPLFLFLQFMAIEFLDADDVPAPPSEEDLLGAGATLPGEVLDEIQEAVSVYVPGSHWFFAFDWINPQISNPFHDGTYSNEVPLGGEISFADSGFETVFPTSGPRVDLFLTQGPMTIPAMAARTPPTGRTDYFTIQIPVSMNPGPAVFHLTHNASEVRGSPAALSILAPEVIRVEDSSVCAGDTLHLEVRNFTSALLDSGQITGELVGPASGPVVSIEPIMGIVGTEIQGLDVLLPSSAAFVPGRYHLFIRRNGVTVLGGDRAIALCEPEPDIDRIVRLTDSSDSSNWMRPGDRIRIEGDNLAVPAYGASLLRLTRDGSSMDLPTTMIDPEVLEVNLPTTLPLGRYEATVAFAVTPTVETDPEPLEVRGRMDGDFALIRIHEFITPREETAEMCTDASRRRWTLRTLSVRTPGGPDEYAYGVFDDRDRPVSGASGRFTAGPSHSGGVKLSGNCRLLLLVDRTDDDGVPSTPPPWNLSAFYYNAVRDRFEPVGELSGISLPDAPCCLSSGFFLVSPDGSVVVRGLWRGFDERTSFGLFDVSSDRNICRLVSGFCEAFACPDCGFGTWRAQIADNQLVLLEITGGINRNWIPDRTRGPVGLPRSGDPTVP